MGLKNIFLKTLKIFDFFIFFGSKTLKTHQIDGFRSRGPSKNARGYRFHAYKWSNHHITGWKNKILDFYKVPETSWKNTQKIELEKWCNQHQKSLKKVHWRFYCGIRSLVPMSYTIFADLLNSTTNIKNNKFQAGKTKLLIFSKCWKRPERTLKR